jgi:hypothetical protein
MRGLMLCCLLSGSAVGSGGCRTLLILPEAPAVPSATLVVLPAQPRDELLADAEGEVFAPEPGVLEAVAEWHAAAAWDAVEEAVRADAAAREACVVSLWRGEVVRLDSSGRSHEFWYLVVLMGPPFRPASGAGFAARAVCSLEFDGPGPFLEAVADALELIEQDARAERPMLAAGPFQTAIMGSAGSLNPPAVRGRRVALRRGNQS